MAERLPKLVSCIEVTEDPVMMLVFDQYLTRAQQVELRDLVALQFAGQLRRDPNAPQTPPEALRGAELIEQIRKDCPVSTDVED